MSTQTITARCPFKTENSNNRCVVECALYNLHTNQCAIFNISDKMADVAHKVDELKDAIKEAQEW